MNLQNWINQARSHWKENRPKLYQSLKTQGTLEPMLKQAAEQTYQQVSELEQAGYQPDEAFQMARETYLFPPGEPESSQPESSGPGILNSALQTMSRTLEMESPQPEDQRGV